jgi:starvation-inducible DNA-binding protein
MELHKLFEGQYQELEEAVDAIAERINKLGSPTPGTMKEFLSMATLKESSEKSLTSKKMIELLLKDHESACVGLRKDIAKCSGPLHDVGTADFLTGLLEAHETTAWKLRRYIG